MDDFNPYQSPSTSPRFTENRPVTAPPVLVWYKVFCALMALMYVACFVFGVVLLQLDAESLDLDMPPDEVWINGIVLSIVGLPFAALYGAALFFPRRGWVWIYGFVTIGLSMTSCCCLPFAIPLLIFWIQTPTKDYFCS